MHEISFEEALELIRAKDPRYERDAYLFVREALDEALKLEAALGRLRTDQIVALLHYSPVKETLAGERLEIYPFLGSYLLAEAVDKAGADLVIHGHAHAGHEKGVTARGIPVRNTALPLLRRGAVGVIGSSWLVSLLAAGYSALGVTFTNDTLISSGTADFEGQEIVVSNCTVTIDGSHVFGRYDLSDLVVTDRWRRKPQELRLLSTAPARAFARDSRHA